MKECERIADASALLDGELSEKQRAEYHSHLRQCATCEGEVESLGRLRNAFAQMPTSIEARERILSAIRESARLSMPRRIPVRLAVAACILVSLGLSIGLNIYLALNLKAGKTTAEVTLTPLTHNTKVGQYMQVQSTDTIVPGKNATGTANPAHRPRPRHSSSSDSPLVSRVTGVLVATDSQGQVLVDIQGTGYQLRQVPLVFEGRFISR